MTERLSYTREEAAALVGVKVDTIRRAVNSGKLRAKRTGKDGGGKYLITREALKDWLDSLEDA